MDSGAARSVCPVSHCDEFPVVATPDSLNGRQFKTASGARIANQGDRTIRGTDNVGRPLALRYAVADVTTALDSVSQICDAGNSVVFNKWGGFIAGPHGRVNFDRVDDTYVRTTWVKRPKLPKRTGNTEETTNTTAAGTAGSTGFGRPGPSP